MAPYSKGRAEFVRERDDLLRQVAHLNTIIETIDRAIASEPGEPSQGEHSQEPPPPVEGEYITMRTGKAIVSYLSGRAKVKVTYAQLEEHLVGIGKAQIGDRNGKGREGRLHTIAITIPMLAKHDGERPPLVEYSEVRYDPPNDNINPYKSFVWLAKTAGAPLPKRNQGTKKKLKDSSR